jgi:hypothetical protein
MTKDKGGRPTVMTKDVLLKLDECFLADLSDEQACYIAGISTTPFYEYQDRTEGYKERKHTLKNMTTAKAKINIAKEINDADKEISKWYLERKLKSEFSTRQEVDNSGTVTNIVVASNKDKEALEDKYE